jgi:Uma2 family endonuclease
MVAEQRIEKSVSPVAHDALEARTGVKYEWFDGAVFAMAGASPTHNTISANVLSLFYNQLRGKECQPWGSDQRVWIAESNLLTYPDVLIACPPHEWDERHTHALRNPRVVIEVLSPSTESYDRAGKFASYRTLPSLTDYVLIATQFQQIEHYQRQGGNWLLHIAQNVEECINLPSVDCQLRVRDVYERLELPNALTFFHDEQEATHPAERLK